MDNVSHYQSGWTFCHLFLLPFVSIQNSTAGVAPAVLPSSLRCLLPLIPA
jgi:hypothetical protein